MFNGLSITFNPVLAALMSARIVPSFNPLTLFAAGEPGVWYDPSDFSTMFQDAAGTTPVTAVEQPVGLILDKSKGLVLGPELVTNGTFDTADGWTLGAGWSIANGVASYSGSLGANKLRQAWAGQNGKTYKVTLTFTMKNTPNPLVRVTFQLGGVGQNVFVYSQGSLQNGQTYTLTGYGTPTTVSAFEFQVSSNQNYQMDFDVDNISVRELTGNHAYQTTATSRPVLSARYNLLTKTEQFDDAVWRKDNVTATGGILTASSSGTYRAVLQQYGTVNGTFKYSVRIKAGTSSWVSIIIGDRATAGVDNYFDVQSGVVGSSRKIGSGFDLSAPLEILPADEDGYLLCTVTFTASLSKALWLYVCVVDNNGSSSVTAGKTLLVKNASLVPVNQAHLPYQRVNTATDYDSDPAKFKPYLSFDGVDDWLVTNTITPGIDKVQVFAGVRKLRDATTTIVVENSNNPDNNAGTFVLATAVPNASSTYFYGSRGSSAVQSASASGYSAPVTNVVSGISNISNDQAILRINVTQVAQSTADQGTGNYGNYPLYIGRRAGTSLPFNGHLYSLIVRFGNNLPIDTIEKTEKYMNLKTAAIDWREITDSSSFRWNSATASPDAE